MKILLLLRVLCTLQSNLKMSFTNNFTISTPAARMLEWPEFLNYLSGFAAAAPGRQKIQEMRPPDDLKTEIGLTHEALQVALKDQIPSLQTLEDCEQLIHRSAIENQTMDSRSSIFRGLWGSTMKFEVPRRVGIVNFRYYIREWITFLIYEILKKINFASSSLQVN